MRRRLRLDKDALFSQLGYVPHAGQALVHASRAKRRVVACGTRFGKSVLATYEAVAFLLAPSDGALGWLVAPTYELTRRVYERVINVLYERMPHRVLTLDERQHVIRVANLGGGVSELRARSADKPAGLLGEALDFLIVDEADKVRDDVWDGYIAARLVDRDGTALLISTPSTVNAWFFKQFRRGKKDPDYQSFAMPTTSNPHISPDLVEAERARLDPDEFRCQYLGEFLGIDTTPCTTCGGPDRYARASISLTVPELPRYCADCGLIVHEDGTTAVAVDYLDRLACQVMVFGNECSNDVPELPEYCRRILFVSARTPENPEELPSGC